jgi:thymidylate synthase (FAD)
MNVKLVSLTQPHPNMGDMNCEDLIAYCARVSNPSNQNNTETAPNLLKYLIKHKHWSPFEMASMTLEIKTSRAIAAQILRHRSFSFQEFSQRYSIAQELEPLELRKQAEKNRQSSADEFTDALLSTRVREHLGKAVSLYNEAIKKGVAKECARLLLPLTTQTTMYMSGTVRSWIHYIDLRSKEDTQREHRQIAESCKEIFKEHFPNISLALGWRE